MIWLLFLHVCVDFAVDFEGIESLKDGVVIISTYFGRKFIRLNKYAIKKNDKVNLVKSWHVTAYTQQFNEKYSFLNKKIRETATAEHLVCLNSRNL